MTVVCCQETSQHKAQQGTDMQPHCGEAGRSTSLDRGIQGWIESYGWGSERTFEARGAQSGTCVCGGGGGGWMWNGKEVDKGGLSQARTIVQ